MRILRKTIVKIRTMYFNGNCLTVMRISALISRTADEKMVNKR